MQMNGNGEQINGPGSPHSGWDIHDDMHDRRDRDGRMHWDDRRDRMDKRMGPGMGKRKPRANGKHHGGGKVFVGGLASKTTEDTLMKVFCQFGQVVHASVLVD